MNFFSDALSRLKYELRVSKDGEVAATLGMSKTAFAERKRRGAFPEREVRDLAVQRPDLNIDVDYVLTGVSLDLGKTMAAYADAPEGRQLLHDVTFGNVPGNPPDRHGAADALPQGCIDEAMVYQAVINAVDLLSLEAKIDAQQLAKAVVKLCLRKAG